MSDIAIEYRIKNARLKRAILSKWPSYSAFAAEFGLPQQRLSGLLCMRFSPLRLNGEWTDLAWSISSALHLEPEELWPQYMQKALERRTGAVELTLDEAAQIADAKPRINNAILQDMRQILRPREWEAVRRHIALGEGLDEVGADWDRSRERVRQIAMKGLRRMRARANKQGVGYSDAVEA